MEYASLVLLSYRRPDFLEQSLRSLHQASNETPFELIVVDDGSRDACWPFLFQTLRQYELSTLVLNAGSNLGVGVGMNRGFALARGKWVAKLDADLEYQPGWLDAAVAVLERFPRVAVVGFFDYRHYNAADTRFNRLAPLAADGRTYGYVVDDFVGSGFLMRRADWLRYGVAGVDFQSVTNPVPNSLQVAFVGFEEGSAAFAEDVAWKHKMQALGGQLAILDQDYVTNFGFGLGNSTVVVADEAGQPQVEKIHTQPLLFGVPSA